MTITCAHCAEAFEPTSPKAKYCGTKCRKAAFRKRGGAQVVTLGTVVDVPHVAGTVAATRAELVTAGRVDTHLGQSALALAARIDGATAVMGFAALVKELRATMVEALKGAARQADELDELEERRRQKFASA